MKRTLDPIRIASVTLLLSLTSWAFASDAETTATASAGRGRSGTAAATARYEGDVGFARTSTRTGLLNLARSVAVGFDENGLSLSVSSALAPRTGPAVATNMTFSLGTNGQVAVSAGRSVATGGLTRSVTAGGSTTTGSPLRPAVAISQASGRTEYGGTVRAVTQAEHRPAPRAVIRVRPLLRR